MVGGSGVEGLGGLVQLGVSEEQKDEVKEGKGTERQEVWGSGYLVLSGGSSKYPFYFIFPVL